MDAALIPPAETMFLTMPGSVVYALIPVIGIAIFAYMIYTRLKPMLRAAPDDRWGELGARVPQLLKIWLLQYRHPRYMVAGVLHILLFAGFLILGLRSTELALLGIWPDLTLPGMDGGFGHAYGILRSYAATWVLIVAIIAMVLFPPRPDLFRSLCASSPGQAFPRHHLAVQCLFMRLGGGTSNRCATASSDEQLDDLESFGVKKLEDFTWKHMLDFYSCADCGRCSDNCPANAVGRPLSPRFITIKGRDLHLKITPLSGGKRHRFIKSP
jgi:ferredoxin